MIYRSFIRRERIENPIWDCECTVFNRFATVCIKTIRFFFHQEVGGSPPGWGLHTQKRSNTKR